MSYPLSWIVSKLTTTVSHARRSRPCILRGVICDVSQSGDVFEGNFPGFGWMKKVPQRSKPLMMAAVTGLVGIFYPQVKRLHVRRLWSCFGAGRLTVCVCVCVCVFCFGEQFVCRCSFITGACTPFVVVVVLWGLLKITVDASMIDAFSNFTSDATCIVPPILFLLCGRRCYGTRQTTTIKAPSSSQLFFYGIGCVAWMAPGAALSQQLVVILALVLCSTPSPSPPLVGCFLTCFDVF